MQTTLYCSHPEIVVIKKAKSSLLTRNNNRPTVLSDLKLHRNSAANGHKGLNNGSMWKHTSITLREGGIRNFPVYHMMLCRVSGSANESCGDEENEDENSSPEKTKDHLQNADTERSISLVQSSNLLGHMVYESVKCDQETDTLPELKNCISVCHSNEQPDEPEVLLKIPTTYPMLTCQNSSTEHVEEQCHVTKSVSKEYIPNCKNHSGSVPLQRVRYEREEYRCQMCSYTCTTEKAFFKHLKLHSMGLSIRKVKISCVICGKDRPTEIDMNKHMRKHRDNQYFCCDICIFRTVQLKKLIQHRRMHTGEKPHLCPHCAYRSARRDNLRSHVRRVHKKENLYCDTFSPRGVLVQNSSDPVQH